MDIKMKCILMFLLLKIFCFYFSESYKYDRPKRSLDGTTTAEPRIDLLKKNNNNTSIKSAQNLSTVGIFKISKNLDLTTPTYPTNTTLNSTNLRHIQLPTTNSYHTTVITTATPKTVAESTSTVPERQFDVLSFLGGCLFTFCLTGIGFFGWKMYALHLERSYRTI